MEFMNLKERKTLTKGRLTPCSTELIKIDFENDVLLVESIPFLDNIINKLGNVFYNQGLIVLTETTNFNTSSFDLDFKGQYTEGGSYVIHSNGDVVNYGLPNKPVYYNYKTKKKFAKGGGVGSMLRNRRGY